MSQKPLNFKLITHNAELTILRICQQCYNFSDDTGLTVLNVNLIINCVHPWQTAF